MSEESKLNKAFLSCVDAMVLAAPILGKYGLKDDEAWGAYSGVIRALSDMNKALSESSSTEEETGK